MALFNKFHIISTDLFNKKDNFPGENLVSKPPLQDQAQANSAPTGHADGVDVARSGQESGRQGGDEGRPGAAVQKWAAAAALPSAAAAFPRGRRRLLLLLPEPSPLPRRPLGDGVKLRRLAAAPGLLQVHQPGGNQLGVVPRTTFKNKFLRVLDFLYI